MPAPAERHFLAAPFIINVNGPLRFQTSQQIGAVPLVSQLPKN